MRKSYIKQTLLAAFFGPLGICYSSVKAALTLTLCTLVLILVLKNHDVHLLIMSIPVAIALGNIIVHTQIRKANNRDFRLSTYIGQVSCRIVGKKPVKREYHKALAKTRRQKKLSVMLNGTLAGLCIFISGLITAPEVTKLLKNNAVPTDHTDTELATIAEQSPDSTEFSDSGTWYTTISESNNFTASLKADEYQYSSDGWYRPKLTLSCIANKTTLLFESVEILGPESTAISLTFNNVKPAKSQEKMQWNTTPDYRSAIAPRAIAIISRLTEIESVDVTFQPFGGDSSSKTSSFNLSNSHDVVQTVKKQCSW